ncbi:MAG: hypothetical protein LBB61_02425 [Treponema sp.]|nr:hypothetical protein [Treponema sp.]
MGERRADFPCYGISAAAVHSPLPILMMIAVKTAFAPYTYKDGKEDPRFEDLKV